MLEIKVGHKYYGTHKYATGRPVVVQKIEKNRYGVLLVHYVLADSRIRAIYRDTLENFLRNTRTDLGG